MKPSRVAVLFSLSTLLTCASSFATNTNEDLAGTFTLPDPLILQNGKPVTDTKTWTNKRRPEILKLYHENLYGSNPSRIPKMKFDVWDVDKHALDGKAVRKQINITFAGHTNPVLHVLLYTPANAKGPVPTFVCLSFSGNYKVTTDPGVKIYETWDRKNNTRQMPKDLTRGTSHSWKIPETLARGYGIAVLDYNDIEPDLADGSGWQYGVRSLFKKPGDTIRVPNEWGAIGAWAWGASRVVDYLETDKDVDKKQLIMLGQSRLGKTALWEGAQEPRFAMVIASCSGEMGAALARRDFGETVTSMSKSFPYQFAPNFITYSNRIPEMPVDSHFLISLIAPRPLYLNTGSEDLWSDPRGEWEAAIAAAPVYALFGKQSLVTNLPPSPASGGSGAVLKSDFLETFPPPPLDTAVMHDIAFSCHTGKHDIYPQDWDRFLDFADLQLKPIK